jgi:hypothetical protein
VVAIGLELALSFICKEFLTNPILSLKISMKPILGTQFGYAMAMEVPMIDILMHDRPSLPTNARLLVPAAELKRYQKALGMVMEALEFYADPEEYHAVAFMVERPAGGFADDFGSPREHRHPHYDRPMPGKRARKALKKLTKRYGDLTVLHR